MVFNLLKNKNTDIQNSYFQKRSKRANSIRNRTDLNFFAFHFSSSIMQKIRNFFLKFLIKKKRFIDLYLGKVYKR